MYYFVFQGDVELVGALLDGGADIGQPGNAEVTPLHVAAMCGQEEVGCC